MGIEINVGHGYVFHATNAAVKSGKKVIIHQGGTGSGKTYDIMTWLIYYAISHRGHIITVVSESRPHLDIGAIRILKAQLMAMNLYDDDRFNKTSGTYSFANGSIIEFFSSDRIGKAVGARRDVLYGNEINHQRFEVWDELARRSALVIGDFNPTAPFWLDKYLAFNTDTIVIKSNYKDNPFLGETERTKIERRAEMDENFYRVHVLAEYGSTEGLVFPDWKLVDEMPEGAYLYGIDFGFVNDATAIVRVAITGSDIFAEEVCYRTGLTNPDIAEVLRLSGVGYADIVADSAEPKSIEELRRHGYRVMPSVKGADSVLHGIDTIKRYTLNVTRGSINLIHELRNYTWKLDVAGNPMNRPIDDHNHAIDALRYVVGWKVAGKTGKIVHVAFN